MRHRLNKKSYNRDTKSRRSLLVGVTVAVLEHGEILTTKAKALQAKRLIESAISTAQAGTLASRRQLHRIFGRRSVVNNLCDRVAPVFTTRQSGFTRLALVGPRRGDNTIMYRLSLVEVLPPSKKAIAQKQAQEKKSAAKSKPTPKKRRGLFGTKSPTDQAAKESIKLEQTKDEKVSKLSPTAERRATSRAGLTGGGRGK